MSAYQVLLRSERGGYVRVDVGPVHAHECRYWRMGNSHGPCTCDANDLLAQAVDDHAEKVTCPTCGADTAAFRLFAGVQVIIGHTHRDGRYQCRAGCGTPALTASRGAGVDGGGGAS